MIVKEKILLCLNKFILYISFLKNLIIGKSLNKNYPKAKRQFNIQNYAKPGYRILLRPENEFYYTSGTQARQDIGLGESRY